MLLRFVPMNSRNVLWTGHSSNEKSSRARWILLLSYFFLALGFDSTGSLKVPDFEQFDDNV